MGSVSTQYMGSIIDILSGMGFSARDALSKMGLTSAELNNSKYRIDRDILAALMDAASEALSEPNIGLEVGYHFRIATFTDTGSILAHCKTLAEAAEMNGKYQKLVETVGKSSLVRRDDGVFLVWDEGFEDHDKYRHLTELIVGGYVLTTNWLSWGFDGGSKYVSFKHKAPENTDRYYEIFQCPVHFGAAENLLAFDEDYVDRELPTSNPDKLLQVSNKLDEVLRSFDQQSKLQAQAVAEIHAAIRNRRLSIGEVGRALNMSERTFRRALRADGLTYRGLVESVRQNICKTYMEDGRSLTEIAQILGYNDQSAFTRAFKNWYGVVPSEYKTDKFTL